MLVEREFGEAVVNLVSSACYAMQRKQEERVEEAATQGNDEQEPDGSTDDSSAKEPEEVYSPLLTVSSRLVDDVIEVRVRDNGPGIAEDVMDRIFNPFFTTREGLPGAGLGLPIAADVARRMGGDLVVDTVFGEYAEFTLHVPMATATEEDEDDLEDEGTSYGAAPEVPVAGDSVNGTEPETGGAEESAADGTVEEPAPVS